MFADQRATIATGLIRPQVDGVERTFSEVLLSLFVGASEREMVDANLHVSST